MMDDIEARVGRLGVEIGERLNKYRTDGANKSCAKGKCPKQKRGKRAKTVAAGREEPDNVVIEDDAADATGGAEMEDEESVETGQQQLIKKMKAKKPVKQGTPAIAIEDDQPNSEPETTPVPKPKPLAPLFTNPRSKSQKPRLASEGSFTGPDQGFKAGFGAKVKRRRAEGRALGDQTPPRYLPPHLNEDPAEGSMQAMSRQMAAERRKAEKRARDEQPDEDMETGQAQKKTKREANPQTSLEHPQGNDAQQASPTHPPAASATDLTPVLVRYGDSNRNTTVSTIEQRMSMRERFHLLKRCFSRLSEYSITNMLSVHEYMMTPTFDCLALKDDPVEVPEFVAWCQWERREKKINVWERGRAMGG